MLFHGSRSCTSDCVSTALYFVQHRVQIVECIAALAHSINAVAGARLWSESSYKIVFEVLTGRETDAKSQVLHTVSHKHFID